MSEGQRFCTACGSAIKPGQAYCGHCGERIGGETLPVAKAAATAPPGTAPQPVAGPAVVPPAASPAPVPAPAATSETVLGVIPNLQRRRGMFAYDAVVLVVTTQRLIMAVLSAEALKEAAREAAAEAKADGKGLLAQTWSTMTSGMRYHQRYTTMSPDQTLADNPKNQMIPLAQIRSVRFRNRQSNENAPDELFINTAGGRIVLSQRNMNIGAVKNMLKRVVHDVR